MDEGNSETMEFMNEFIATHKPPPSTIDHFRSIAWTNAILSDPAYRVIPTYSRSSKASGEDYFFSATLNTAQTIPHLVSLQLRDFKTPDLTSPPLPSSSPSLSPSSKHKKETVVPEKPDIVVLLSLSRPGLDGHPGVIHGGMACAILDEMMGLCVMLHQSNLRGTRDPLFTVNLNTTYRNPVPTGEVVVVRCWLVRREGRKWFSHGQIVTREGRICTEAEGMWVLAKRKDVKL